VDIGWGEERNPIVNEGSLATQQEPSALMISWRYISQMEGNFLYKRDNV
jgi:hypothetical protein